MKKTQIIIIIITIISLLTVLGLTSYYLLKKEPTKKDNKIVENTEDEEEILTIEIPTEDIKIGDTIQIKTTSKSNNNETIKYSSSEKEIATIDENGLITALSEGTTTITATQGKYIDNILIEVKSTETSNAKTKKCDPYCSAISEKSLIKAINLKKLNPIITQKNYIFTDAQSLTVTDDYIVTAAITSSSNVKKIKKYGIITNDEYEKYKDKYKGKTRINVYKRDKVYTEDDNSYKHYSKTFGHSNGMTYIRKYNQIYALPALSKKEGTYKGKTVTKNKYYYYFDASFNTDGIPSKRGDFTYSNGDFIPVTGIAYSNKEDLFYLLSGDYIRVYNEKNKVLETIKLASGNVGNYKNQDIGAYGRNILHIRYNDNQECKDYLNKNYDGMKLYLSTKNKCPRNAIDIYYYDKKHSSNNTYYKGSYIFYGKSGYELESIAHYKDKTFALYFNKTNDKDSSSGKEIKIRSPYSYVYLVDLDIDL